MERPSPSSSLLNTDNQSYIYLEDIVIPTKRKEKKKPEKVKAKKETTKQKKPEIKKKKKEPKDQLIKEDYKKIPHIDQNQKFTMKRNKAPKGSSKLRKKELPEKIKKGNAGNGKGNIRHEEIASLQDKHSKVLKETFSTEKPATNNSTEKQSTIAPSKLQNSKKYKKSQKQQATENDNAPNMEIKEKSHKKNGPKEKTKNKVAKLSSLPSITSEHNKTNFDKKDSVLVPKKDKQGIRELLRSLGRSEQVFENRVKKKVDSLPKLSMIPSLPKKKQYNQTQQNRVLDGRLFKLDEFRKNSGLLAGLAGSGQQKGYNFGSLSIGDESFQNEWYARAIVSKVSQNWYPPAIAYLGASGVTVISFSILRTGSIAMQKTWKKSPFPTIDRSAANAVSLSDAFPPLPDDYDKEKLDIKFSFYVNVYPKSSERGR